MARDQLFRVLNDLPAATNEYDRLSKLCQPLVPYKIMQFCLRSNLILLKKARDLVAQWRAAPPVSKWLEAYWVRDMDEIHAIVEAIAPKMPGQTLVQ